jgi:Amt family ammonium transporter
LKLLGYHDAYASGVIHAVAGGFALGVLIVL